MRAAMVAPAASPIRTKDLFESGVDATFIVWGCMGSLRLLVRPAGPSASLAEGVRSVLAGAKPG